MFALLLLAGIAVGSRLSAQAEPPVHSSASSKVLVLGVVGSASRSLAATSPDDFLRGIRVWQAHLKTASGTVFDPNVARSVRVIVASTGSSASSRLAAVTVLARSGVSAILTPSPSPVVLRIGQRFHVPVLSSAVPKSLLATDRFAFSLSPSRLGDPQLLYNAMRGLLISRRRRLRIAIVAGKGWAAIGQQASQLAQQQGIESKLTTARGSDPRSALAQARRFGADLLYVLARPALVVSWQRRYRRSSDPPWATTLSAGSDPGTVGRPLLAAVQWNPFTSQGGMIFSAGTFTADYEKAYNALPGTSAAEGAASALAVSAAVGIAHSTGPARIAAALAEIAAPSLFGELQFHRQAQAEGPPAGLLLIRGSAVTQTTSLPSRKGR